MTQSPLIIALDHSDPGDARACVAGLTGVVQRVKVGSILFTRCGPSFVTELAESGLGVFLDLKFHDTPGTVAGAARAAARLGVELLTVHAAGGGDMIAAAREAIEGVPGRPDLLAVTVLTSLDTETHRRVVGPGGWSLDEAVVARAQLALEAGADGCVCAAHETASLRAALGVAPRLVVPGIRPAWSESSHSGQARTATPAVAMAAGATDLVVGRAVTAAGDPVAAVQRIEREISG